MIFLNKFTSTSIGIIILLLSHTTHSSHYTFQCTEQKTDNNNCYVDYTFFKKDNLNQPLTLGEFYQLWIKNPKPFMKCLEHLYENHMRGNKSLEQYGFLVIWRLDKEKPFCMHIKWPTTGTPSSWVTASGQDLIDIQNKIHKEKPNANFVSLIQSNKDKKCIGFISFRRTIVITPIMVSAPATLYTFIKEFKDTKPIENLFKLLFAIANNSCNKTMIIASRGGDKFAHQTNPRIHIWIYCEELVKKLNCASKVVAWINSKDEVVLEPWFHALITSPDSDQTKNNNS